MAVLAIAALAAVLTAILPVFWLVLPGLTAYAMLRTKPWSAVLPAALLMGFSYVLTGSPLTAGLLTGMAALTALTIYYFQVNRMGNSYTALTAAGVFLVFLYLLMCLPGLLSGTGAFSQIQVSVDETVALFRQMLAMMPELPKEATDMYAEYLTLVSRSVASIAVPIACAAAGILGLSNFLFFRAFAGKTQENGLLPMRPFAMWSIPRSAALGLFLLLVGSLVLTWTEWSYAEAFTATVNVLVSMPLILQGLSTVDYLILKKGKNPTGKRVLVYVLLGLFFWLAQMPLMLVGCFEQLFRIRSRPFPPTAA